MTDEDISPEKQALLERIEAAQKRREASEKDSAKQRELTKLADQAREEELEAERTERTIELEALLGPRGIRWDFVPCWSAVVAMRCPHFLTWQQYREAKMPTDTPGIRNLLFRSKGEGSCLLYPKTVQEFDLLLPNEPGLLDAASVVAVRLASAASNERLGK